MSVCHLVILSEFPFFPLLQIGWYNEKVQTPFHLSYHEDTVAFCVISSPSMFEKAFKPYVQSLKVLGSRDPLDDCVGKQYQRLKEVGQSLLWEHFKSRAI